MSKPKVEEFVWADMEGGVVLMETDPREKKDKDGNPTGQWTTGAIGIGPPKGPDNPDGDIPVWIPKTHFGRMQFMDGRQLDYDKDKSYPLNQPIAYLQVAPWVIPAKGLKEVIRDNPTPAPSAAPPPAASAPPVKDQLPW